MVMSHSRTTRVRPSSVRNSGWVRSMPESMKPSRIPAPVSPRASSRFTGVIQALSRPESSKEKRSSEGSMYSTWGCSRSRGASSSGRSTMAYWWPSSSAG